MDEKYESVKLCYAVHKYSSYSANYVPQNIMVNNPSDQLSRWFTDSSNANMLQPQYIILKLKSLSIVDTIIFGKYLKPHVSDLKKFQVFGGTDENNFSLLLSAGLKKDSAPETFKLRNRTTEGLYLPVQYIKIVPLLSWGPAYNYTIWYVELHGTNQEDLVQNAMETFNLRKEEEAVRILLKHLRRRRYKDAFEALSRESGVQLEGPTQSRLWNALVENGDYKLAEEILEEAMNEGEMDWYLSWQPYQPEWRQLSPCSAAVEARLCCGDNVPPTPRPRPHELACADREPRMELPVNTARSYYNSSELLNGGAVGAGAAGVEGADACEAGCGGACTARPGPRGGHQLVVDTNTGTLYLFGGWNGTEDLDDLWSYSTGEERWSLLCRHSSQVGGPSPRSCHKMVFDPVNDRLYTLGRYLDNAQRVPANMNSELYVYDVSAGAWSLACANTAGAGGPRLVFDHQMCLDADTQTIYVFGGRVLPSNTEELVSPQYSGLYAYYISSNTWQQLLADRHELPAPQPRVSHSILFHPVQRRLYMFAGQRNKEQLLDLWWWDVGEGRCGALCAGAAACPPPAAGFTQRATLDPDTDEMFVLSGMSKEKDKRVYNSLWVFSLRRMTWTCVYRNDSVTPAEPRPRFAHQLVYDPVRKIHYLFGGNPGTAASPRLRLDDLWALRLRRVSRGGVWRALRATLREAHYREMAAAPELRPQALHYLRHDLSAALDHCDPAQVSQFQKLATALFTSPPAEWNAACALTPHRTRTLARRRARRTPHADLAHALAAVLGADDSCLDSPQPFEEVRPPTPDTWDVGEVGGVCEGAASEEEEEAGWAARDARVRLYDRLCTYFRPSTVPPRADVGDLIAL
ncbi:Muskelin [Papilio xuthus]|uniref:Muskelin n=1 Tax=Papilio xuthus TaxID=66420 RepID=A0A194QER7_PAPXU|nr:Muskelin [Papilio xuthus]